METFNFNMLSANGVHIHMILFNYVPQILTLALEKVQILTCK